MPLTVTAHIADAGALTSLTLAPKKTTEGLAILTVTMRLGSESKLAAAVQLRNLTKVEDSQEAWFSKKSEC